MDSLLSRSLDDIITEKRQNKPPREGGNRGGRGGNQRGGGRGGHGGGAGPSRNENSSSFKKTIRHDAQNDSANASNKIYIGSFNTELSDDDIRSLFVEDNIAAKEVELLGAEGRQYLVVTFDTVKEATKAINTINGKKVDFAARPLNARFFQDKQKNKNTTNDDDDNSGGIVVVKKSSSEHPANKGNRVRVSNLPWDLNEDEVEQIFSSVGKVTNCSLITTTSGKSTGVATITFVRPQMAEKAVEEFNGALVNKREINVTLIKGGE